MIALLLVRLLLLLHVVYNISLNYQFLIIDKEVLLSEMIPVLQFTFLPLSSLVVFDFESSEHHLFFLPACTSQLYVMFGIVAGYLSARLYKTFKVGKKWLQNILMTAAGLLFVFLGSFIHCTNS